MTVVSTDTLLSELRSRSGRDAARASTDDDVFDGVRPRLLVEPSTAAETAEILGWASSEGLKVLVVGGGTKLAWGAPSGPVDLLLSTSRLRTVIDHRHGDLTTTVESGTPLSLVNKTLTGQRQWLPWDPPWADRATIGGIVATNDSGPRRHGYGTARDSIIGLTIARIDGAVAKAGTSPLTDVYDYAERIQASGFVFMNTPGYDPTSVTGMAAGGCNVCLFTTGRGSCFGFPTVPVVKIASNSQMGKFMDEDMDINTGTIAEGVENIGQAGEKIYRCLLETASGKKTFSEALGHREFIPWRIGPVL